jgi:molybdopterin molybdotransferase
MGLPGNPVSALVTFEIFVKPLIQRLGGGRSVERIKIKAKLMHRIESDGRESYLRARVSQVENEFEVRLVGSQDSGVLSSLVEANALLRIPSETRWVPEGDSVEVWLLRQDGVL